MGNVAIYLGFSVGLYCWQIWHSASATSRSVLMNGRQFVKAMNNFYLCHHGHFVHRTIGQWQRWLRKRFSTEQAILYTWFLNTSSAEVTLMSNYIAHKYPSIHSERSIHMLLPQMSFSPNFQSCSYQVPDHPTNPLSIQGVGERSHIWPFLLQTKCMSMCNARNFAHCEDFPLLVSFRTAPEGVIMLQLSTSKWCLNSVQIHQLTRS